MLVVFYISHMNGSKIDQPVGGIVDASCTSNIPWGIFFIHLQRNSFGWNTYFLI